MDPVTSECIKCLHFFKEGEVWGTFAEDFLGFYINFIRDVETSVITNCFIMFAGAAIQKLGTDPTCT